MLIYIYESEDMQDSEIIDSLERHLTDSNVKNAIEMQSYIRGHIGNFLRGRGYVEIPPVIISPITDPLNHPHLDPSIDYYGYKYGLTKSMIFHKQIMTKQLGSIFIFSPNIRLETPEKRDTGRHLSEFTQVDVEKRGASRDDMISLVEDMVTDLLEKVLKDKQELLLSFGRSLKVPKKPFSRVKFLEAEAQYGSEFESILSREAREPFWIVDIPLQKREFYDKEKEDEPGILDDMDLIYPEGFGEALSGGAREYEIERIKERISKKGQSESQFKWILEYAKKGLLPSTGFGIGIERLTRYICGLKRIEDTHPFPKVPGELSI